MTSGEIAELHQYIQQFNVTDPWEDLISRYIENRSETTTTEILINALSFNPQAVGIKDLERVAAILMQIGWRRLITSRNGKSLRLWKAPKGKNGFGQGSVRLLVSPYIHVFYEGSHQSLQYFMHYLQVLYQQSDHDELFGFLKQAFGQSGNDVAVNMIIDDSLVEFQWEGMLDPK